jgi:hypothetical protein
VAGCRAEPSALRESADQRLVRAQAEKFILEVMEARQEGARVNTVSISGLNALGMVTAPGIVDTDVQLEKAGNGWKIANF